jgi:CHAD domain-containing protein/CYTH domain-containing protein
MDRRLVSADREEGVRRLALKYLDRAMNGLGRLADPEDAEALHDFRVGVRRLRACMRAYDDLLAEDVGPKLRARLKRVVSLSGPGRDAEVQLLWAEKQLATLTDGEKPGGEWLVLRLTEQKRQAYAHLAERLVPRFTRVEKRLRRRLSHYTLELEVGKERDAVSFGAHAASAIRRQCRVLARDLRKVKSVADEKIAHDSRIQGKRLRYLMDAFKGELEVLAPALSALQGLQDLLGELHDLHVFGQTMALALEETALAQAKQMKEAAKRTLPHDALGEALVSDERPGLLALVRRIQTRKEHLFGILLHDWLSEEGRLSKLLDEVERVALDLEAAGSTRASGLVEIERKYLLSGLPPICVGQPATEIDQGWLPGAKLQERLRRERRDGSVQYLRTVKTGRGMIRFELEEPCDEALFRALWPLTESCRVRKRRYVREGAGRTWEIDAFQDRELFLAEVELPSEHARVEVPEWLAPYVVREVTGEDAYVNRQLAR